MKSLRRYVSLVTCNSSIKESDYVKGCKLSISIYDFYRTFKEKGSDYHMKKILSFTNHRNRLILLWIIDTIWYLLFYIGLNMENPGGIFNFILSGYPLCKPFVQLYSLLYIVGGFIDKEETGIKKFMRIVVVLACYIVQIVAFALCSLLMN